MKNQLTAMNDQAIDTCILYRFRNTLTPFCCRNFKIQIPDFNEQELNNLGKPNIVFPFVGNLWSSPNVEYEQDDVFGYFFDSNGNLDSMTHGDFIDDDMEDDFFQWFVLSRLDCTLQRREEGCDNDGICEPWFGETAENCPDCQNKAKNMPGLEGKLFLWEIESLTDHKGKNASNRVAKHYQESYVNAFKYEIAMQYVIYNTTSGNVDYQFVIGESGDPYPEDAPIIAKFKGWTSSAEVKRTKTKKNGSTKSNKGQHTTRFFGQGGTMLNGKSSLLTPHFVPSIDQVYFVLNEDDWKPFPPDSTELGYDFATYINKGIGPKRKHYTADQNVQSQQRQFGPCTSSTGVYFIDNQWSKWNPIPPINGKDAYEHETTLDGEWRIKLVFIVD